MNAAYPDPIRIVWTLFSLDDDEPSGMVRLDVELELRLMEVELKPELEVEPETELELELKLEIEIWYLNVE